MSLNKPNIPTFLPFPLHRVAYGERFEHRIIFKGGGQRDWLTWKSFEGELKRDKAFRGIHKRYPEYEFAIQSGTLPLEMEVAV